MRAAGTVRHGIRIPLAFVFAFSACDSSPSDPPETPTIAVSTEAATVSIMPGQEGTVAVSVTRGGGFTGAIALTLEGAPAGVSGAFTPASIAAGSTISSLALAVASTAVPGTYNLTVRATAPGVTPATRTLQLTVQEHPAIALSTGVTGLTVAQGSSGTAGITIGRTNFSGEVTLTVSGAPTDVTATVAPAATTGNASVLTVDVGAAATTGSYTLTIAAQGAGVADQSIDIPLTIVSAQAPGFSLALEPATLSAQQGASVTTRLTATRTGGFSGAVTLSASGAPAGVTVGFPSVTLTVDTVTLTVAVGALGSVGGSPMPGDYTLTVTGEATGLPTQTATLALTVTAAPGGYTLTVSPAAVSAAAGTAGRAAVRIARTGGFAGSVSLSISGAPTGLTASLAEVTTLADSVELSLVAAADLAPGTYPLTVTGTVAGLADQTSTLTVTITAASTGGFTLALDPASISLAQGADGTSAVNITRTGGFTGDVTLSLTGAPAGLTAVLDATTVSGASTTLRLTAAATLAPGSYTVTVHGNATGITEQTVDLAVTITASGGGNVTLTFCPEDVPIFFAAQDGDGAWTRIDGIGAQFSFNVTQRGGVAYVQDPTETTIFYATAAELIAMSSAECIEGTTPDGKTLTGDVAGLAGTDQAYITLGPVAGFAAAAFPTYTLENVPDGPLDLVAARVTIDAGGATAANKFIIRRGLNLPDNSVIPTLDFGAAEAFDPVLPTLTINGLGTDNAFLGLGYVTASNAGSVGFGTGTFYYFDPQRGAMAPYPGIPAAQQAAGDLHMMNIFASGVGDDPPTRGYFSYFAAAADRTVTLADPLSTPTVSVLATSPYLRLRVQLAVQAAYDEQFGVSFDQTTNGVFMWATAGYFGAGFTNWDVSIPDLSAIGFNAAWGLSNEETEYTVSAYSGRFDAVPSDGFLLQYATRTASITP